MVFTKILSFDWAFWFYWIVATTLGWVSGGLFFPGIALLASGVTAGVFQWFVLQHRIHQPVRWVIATAAGWIPGYFIVLLGIPAELDIFYGVVLGLLVGAAQWLVLRQELHWAGWWIAFSIIGWTTGLVLLPGFLLTGIMAGALTGLALEILLRDPKLQSAGQ